MLCKPISNPTMGILRLIRCCMLPRSNRPNWLIGNDEGCLSVPGVRVQIARPTRIVIEALDLDGQPLKEEVEGMNARVRMHENDHLNGVLIVDRADSKQRHHMKPQIRDLKRRSKKGDTV